MQSLEVGRFIFKKCLSNLDYASQTEFLHGAAELSHVYSETSITDTIGTRASVLYKEVAIVGRVQSSHAN